MRIVVAGYAGEGNLGDDILAARLADIASQALSGSTVVVAWGGRSLWAPPEVETVGRGLSEVLKAVAGSDAVIIGPGGILHNARGFGNRHRDRGLAYYDAITARAAQRGVPVGVIGIGVGPLIGSAARRLTRRILDRCATISVRDDNSRQILSDLGVAHVGVIPDLAVVASEHSRQRPPQQGATLGVCIRPWINGVETRRISRSVASAIDLLAGAGQVTNIVGMPLSASPIEALDDRWPTALVLDAVTGSVTRSLSKITDLNDVERGFADLDVMVSMRLHGVILARNVGTPSVGIVYDDKVRTATAALGSRTVGLTADPESIAQAVRNELAEGRSAPEMHPPDAAADQFRALRRREPVRTAALAGALRQIESLLLAAGA